MISPRRIQLNKYTIRFLYSTYYILFCSSVQLANTILPKYNFVVCADSLKTVKSIIVFKTLQKQVHNFCCLFKCKMKIHLGIRFIKRFYFQQPILACSNGKFKDFLLAHVPILQEKYWPTLWCFESRAQTVLASLLRSRLLPNIKYRR